MYISSSEQNYKDRLHQTVNTTGDLNLYLTERRLGISFGQLDQRRE